MSQSKTLKLKQITKLCVGCNLEKIHYTTPLKDGTFTPFSKCRDCKQAYIKKPKKLLTDKPLEFQIEFLELCRVKTSAYKIGKLKNSAVIIPCKR